MWLPAALLRETPYQKTLANTFQAEGGTAELVEHKADALGIVAAKFPEGAKPVLTLTSRVSTQNYAVDLSAARQGAEGRPRRARELPAADEGRSDRRHRQGARPTRSRAARRRDVEKARAIYEWIVDNTFRNPKTRGCGVGDIRFMLESKDLGGKCADLNALYVGLARAAGLPARDVYGMRVAKSELGLQEPRRRRPRT